MLKGPAGCPEYLKRLIHRATERRVCSTPVSDTQQRFEFLAAQFEMFVRDLEACRSREQRWVLLGGMIRLIEEIDRLLLNEQLALIPPLAKAAHP